MYTELQAKMLFTKYRPGYTIDKIKDFGDDYVITATPPGIEPGRALDPFYAVNKKTGAIRKTGPMEFGGPSQFFGIKPIVLS